MGDLMREAFKIVSAIILLSLPLAPTVNAWAKDGWVFGELHAKRSSWVLPRASKRVIFFTADWCIECRTIKQNELPKLEKKGWSIGENSSAQIQVVDIDDNPELWRKHGSQPDGLPQFVCVYDGQVVRSLRAGCATPMDAWGIGWTYFGMDERPTPKREPVTADSNGVYPVRGSWWSVEGVWNADRGYVINHLLTSSNHTRLQQYADQIRKLSRVEAHSLHSDDHENRVDWSALRGEKQLVSGTWEKTGAAGDDSLYRRAYKKSRINFQWPITISGRSAPARRRLLNLCPT